MLQQQHMKSLFTPAMAHGNSPFSTPPQEMMLYPGKPASYDPSVKKSPSKKSKSCGSTPEKARPKVDALDLSMENKTQLEPVAILPKTVANLQKSGASSKKGSGSNVSSGEEQPSPGKQTKDILDLDSKKVKVHRGAVGENDRNSPLKVPKSTKRYNKPDGGGFPVQTYKFEARPGGPVELPMNYIQNLTSVEGNFAPMGLPMHSMEAARRAASKGAETKTVDANVAIPFYSKPLSIQTSASANQLTEGRSTMGSSAEKDVQPKMLSATTPKKKSNQSVGSSVQISQVLPAAQGKKDGGAIVTNMTKPVMPVLPLPSVPVQPQYHQNQRAVIPPTTVDTESTGQSSSDIANNSNKRTASGDLKVKTKTTSSKKKGLMSPGGDQQVWSSDEKSSKGVPIKVTESGSNTNNSSKVTEGKKFSKKEMQKVVIL